MDQVLEWFGAEIYRDRLARIMAFWRGDERYLVTVNSTQSYYRQIFDDGQIVERAPLNLQHQAILPGVNLPTFFTDFGTVSTAKYWGGRTRFDSTGRNIFIDPVAQSVTEALAMTPLAANHPDMDAHRALRLYRTVCDRLRTKSLWLRTPDLQGPLNTAGLVVNQEELLMAMHSEPEAVHRLLAAVTEFLVSYANCMRAGAEGRLCGNLWPFTFFPCELGVSFTEDLMPLLSAELYREFALPYLRVLDKTFGGLHIHCCGDYGRHADTLKQSGARIKALEFHYPFTKIDELACLSESTVFVPYIILDKQNEFTSIAGYYQHLLDKTDKTRRYWFAFPDDSEEAISFARRHGF